MGRRRLGRETAFKALYRIDLLGRSLEEALAEVDTQEEPQARGFALELLETVGANRSRLDEILEAAAERWELSRMSMVDRAILRLGAAEILFWRWIPNQVSINEYVDIAKKFSTEDSGGFVNAVLDRVSRESETPESPR